MIDSKLRVHMSVLAAGAVIASLPLLAHGATPGTTGVLAWVHAAEGSAAADAPHDLWITGPDGPEPLVSDPGNDLDPAFRPNDRGLIAYAGRGGSGGDRDIRLVRAEGGASTVLVSRPGNDRWPSWSPDGEQVVFAGAVGESTDDYDIYVVNADGTGLRKVVGGHPDQNYPSWSPAGDKIVYQASILVAGKGKGQASTATTALFVYEVESGRSVQITEASRAASAPAWAPDGSRIVFAGTRERGKGLTELFTIRPDGSDERSLAAYGSWPDYTPDGSRVVFAVYNGATESSDIRSVAVASDGSPVPSSGRWEVVLPGSDNIPRYQAVTPYNAPPTPTPTGTPSSTPSALPSCLLNAVCT